MRGTRLPTYRRRNCFFGCGGCDWTRSPRPAISCSFTGRIVRSESLRRVLMLRRSVFLARRKQPSPPTSRNHPMTKRIAVVGAGAVGGYISAHLAAASHDVVAIDGWPEHVEEIKSDGLRIVGMVPSENVQVRFPALHITEVQGLSKGPAIDIAIVAVKSYDTIWATALIAPYLAPGGYVVSTQNGINEDRIATVVGMGPDSRLRRWQQLCRRPHRRRGCETNHASRSCDQIAGAGGDPWPRHASAARARGHHEMRGQLLDHEQPVGCALVQALRERDAQRAFGRHRHERQ